MQNQFLTFKIQPHHLTLQALIYIRQSSLIQVLQNTGSADAQHELRNYARQLGWAEDHIVSVPEDQGRSATSTHGREGFKWLFAEVGSQSVGAIFCFRADRLARDCVDWHRLLKICRMTDTLVIDTQNVYDPKLEADSITLGIQGAMSAAETQAIRQRSLAGRLAKAKAGTLPLYLPVGFVRDLGNQVMLDPNEPVREAVSLLFRKFEELRSGHKVVKFFSENNLLFPKHTGPGISERDYAWGPLYWSKLRYVLANPTYAGAYTYGRFKSETLLLPGEAMETTSRTHPVKQEDWRVLEKNAFPGYITWEDYIKNQKLLAENRSSLDEGSKGAPRSGPALLQGIVRCGRCGHSMVIRYKMPPKGWHYECNYHRNLRSGPTCPLIHGETVEEAVVKALLEAIKPSELETSVASLERAQAQADSVSRQWDYRLQQAQYAADRAEEFFKQVDPKNRLVANRLESDLEAALRELKLVERQRDKALASAPPRLESLDREAVLALAQDFTATWNSATTTNEDRKHLLRFLIEEITLTRISLSTHPNDAVVKIAIDWQTGAWTELQVPLTRYSGVIARIRSLAVDHTDAEIADIFNSEGVLTQRGCQFQPDYIKHIRRNYEIATGRPVRRGGQHKRCSDGRITLQQAALELNVTPCTVIAWCRKGLLEGIQRKPHSPWWIILPADKAAQLRRKIPYKSHRKSVE